MTRRYTNITNHHKRANHRGLRHVQLPQEKRHVWCVHASAHVCVRTQARVRKKQTERVNERERQRGGGTTSHLYKAVVCCKVAQPKNLRGYGRHQAPVAPKGKTPQQGRNRQEGQRCKCCCHIDNCRDSCHDYEESGPRGPELVEESFRYIPV